MPVVTEYEEPDDSQVYQPGDKLLRCNGQEVVRTRDLRDKRTMMVLPSLLTVANNKTGMIGVLEKANTECPELVIDTKDVTITYPGKYMLIATKYIAIECRADDSASQCTDIFDRILIFDEPNTVYKSKKGESSSQLYNTLPGFNGAGTSYKYGLRSSADPPSQTTITDSQKVLIPKRKAVIITERKRVGDKNLDNSPQKRMRCSNDKLTSHDYDQIMTANQEGNQDLITIQEPFRDDHTFTDDHNSNDFVSIDTSKQPNDANKNSEIVKKKPNSKSGKSSEAIPINAIVKRSSRTSVNDSSIERHEDKVDSNVKKDEILVSQSNDVTHAKNVEAVDVVGDSSDEDASNTVVEESSLVAAKHRTIAAVKVKNKKKKTDESKPSSNKFILTRADINDMLDYKPSSKRKGSELNTTTISGNNDLSIDEMNTTAANANETPLKKYRRKFSTFSSHLSNSNSSIKPTGTFNTSVTKAKPTSIDFSDSESDNVDKISKETVNNGRTKGNPKSQINVTSHATKRNTKSKASSGIVELESENTDSDDLLEVKNSKKKASKESNAMKSKSNSSKSSKR